MDSEINTPDNGNSVVDGLNTTDKSYLKEWIKFIGELASNDIIVKFYF